MFKQKKWMIFPAIMIFTLGMAAQTTDWFGGYSSGDFEEQKTRDNGIYYYWQIQSLKKAVPPRFIRMIDIENYSQNSDLLQKGILITYNGLRKTEVGVCGNFNSWQCLPMTRNRYGIYYTMIPSEFIETNELKTIEYKFRVDGFFEYDPANPAKTEDGAGSYVSVYTPGELDPDKFVHTSVSEEAEISGSLKTVTFSIYLPEATTVAVAGNFNHWEHESDFLKKERETGIFRLHKKLKPGNYYYYYIVDGEIMLDTYNPETRLIEEFNEMASYISVSGGE